MTTAREGDPVLSADGSTIVARWRVAWALRGDHLVIPVMPEFAGATPLVDLPDAAFDPIPQIRLRLFATFPDRAYWRLEEDVPADWLHRRNRYLTRPEAAPGADPAGMVVAITELLRSPTSPDFAAWLDGRRHFYQSRIAE